MKRYRCWKKKIYVLLMLMVLVCFTGCGRKETDETTDRTTDLAIESTEEQEQAVDSYVQTRKSLLKDSTYAIVKNPVQNNQGLYKLTLSEDLFAEGWMWQIFKLEHAIFINWYQENLGNVFYVLDPLEMKVLASYQVGNTEGAAANAYLAGEGKLVYQVEGNDTFTVLDLNLTFVESFSLGAPRLCDYEISTDFSSISYLQEDDYNIYIYDIFTKSTRCISPLESASGQGEDNADASIVLYLAGCTENKLAYYYSPGNTWQGYYVILDTKTGEQREEQAEYMGNLAGKDNNYRMNSTIDHSFEYIFGSFETESHAIFIPKDQRELDWVSSDYDVNVTLTQYCEYMEGNQEVYHVGLYDMKNKKKARSTAFTFSVDEDAYYSMTGAVYMQDNSYVFLVYGERYMYVWDLADADTETVEQNVVLWSYDDINVLSKEQRELLDSLGASITEKYDLQIFYGSDIENCKTDQYAFEEINVFMTIYYAMQRLEQCLENFPANMVKDISNTEDGALKIYLCSHISGTDDASVTTAQGLENRIDHEAYMVLDATSVDLEETFYHEFYHAIESYLFTRDKIIDYYGWMDLNPEGYDYDSDYAANEYNADGRYTLRWEENPMENAYFIDTYSKVFAHEDRARIFESAMSYKAGTEDYFVYEKLRNKLIFIDTFLRESFDTSDWPEVTMWERCLK